MTAALFLGFVGLTAAVVATLVACYLNGRTALWMLAGLSVWFIYTGVLGHLGVVKNTSGRPPGIVFLVGPVLVFLVLFILRPTFASKVAKAFPLWIILSTQSFRIVVELFLHHLWVYGLVPRMLTFAGANVDLYIGASAPLIAWLSTRGRVGLRLVLIWNILGLLSLANVVSRALLTAPGPLYLAYAEVPNLVIGMFPYLLIPGFFVPLAVVLHVIAIRVVSRRLSLENRAEVPKGVAIKSSVMPLSEGTPKMQNAQIDQ